MKNNEQLDYPSTGASAGFAIGFWIFYVVMVFTILGLFFKIPF